MKKMRPSSWVKRKSLNVNKKSKAEKINITGQSLFKNFLSTWTFDKMDIKPNTIPIFAIFEPTTLFMAIDGELFSAALTLTISSGNEVAKETTVIPITNFEIFNFRDNATEDLTINSPPITSKKNPKKISNKFIIEL